MTENEKKDINLKKKPSNQTLNQIFWIYHLRNNYNIFILYQTQHLMSYLQYHTFLFQTLHMSSPFNPFSHLFLLRTIQSCLKGGKLYKCTK